MSSQILKIKPGSVSTEYEKMITRSVKSKLMPSIMTRSPKHFTKSTKIQKLIKNRLGWVDSASTFYNKINQIESFGNKALKDGIKHVVVLGMGGSSLCPDLFGKVFGKHKRIKKFSIVDSTDPAALKSIIRKIELKKTLFIVSSKSGGTVETKSQAAFFYEQVVKAKIKNPGKHFTAITDAGSALEKMGKKKKYRMIFINPSDIGGRFSALSYFGLVPAFFAGVELKALLASAVEMEKMLKERDDETNPGLLLGAWIAATVMKKKNKMTLCSSNKLLPLSDWIEQLVAESTGKRGFGAIPVVGETVGKKTVYGNDRSFLSLLFSSEKRKDKKAIDKILSDSKTASVSIDIKSINDLGAHFLLWEAATAVAGQLLKVNPFDEPNVTESKNNTTRLLNSSIISSFEFISPKKSSTLLISTDDYTKKKQSNFLANFLKGKKPPNYIALLNFYHASKATDKLLREIQTVLREKTKMAVLRGYGPRYLHSIGQLYKGGPSDGLFVYFIREKYSMLDIPDQEFGFHELIQAQALGDLQAIKKRKKKTLLLGLRGNPSDGLQEFLKECKRLR